MDKLIARIEEGHVVVNRDAIKVSPLTQFYIDDGTELPDEDDYCQACNGTGEGMAPDSTCGDCGGSGFFNSTKGNL